MTCVSALFRRAALGAATLAAALTLGAGGALAQSSSAAPASSAMVDRPAAKLQGLDKVTARTSTFSLKVGQTANFGSLRITLRACRSSPPVEVPESAAFLEVEDVKPGETAERVFSGWMFASSPALSAMEHAIYDVWVLTCEDGGS
ncbi:hypothetical protein M2352_002913 [Azospirillum fermentarium]|uniref:DUF2155 domain-containing protein n=1 Tax=Azospirillum fermentarium TaxID=1233114 RepID=UPI002226F53A|nr:DUF2155 domain-containing protein [Azospirillum fermentarium]MCW2247322.1 hypothetical protein [Azospirillum fermentarium]